MSTPFIDRSERDYLREQEAGERLRHLKLVRREVAGGGDADEEQLVSLLGDFSDSTEASNSTEAAGFLVAYFAKAERFFPDTNTARNFLDALYRRVGRPRGLVPAQGGTVGGADGLLDEDGGERYIIHVV